MLREGQRVAVAVSGGKDSVSLLHALWRLRERLGVELVGVTIDLGIRGYSEEYVGVAVENFEKLGVPYRVVRLADYGFTIDSATRLRRPVCSVCGTVKRYLLNKVARELGAHVVATGHTLDDFLSVLLQAYIRGYLAPSTSPTCRPPTAWSRGRSRSPRRRRATRWPMRGSWG